MFRQLLSNQQDMKSLPQEVKSFQDIKSLQQEVKSVLQDLKDMEGRIQQVQEVVKNGFVTAHNFGRDRARVLSSVTRIIQFSVCSGTATKHIFFYKGEAGQVSFLFV